VRTHQIIFDESLSSTNRIFFYNRYSQ